MGLGCLRQQVRKDQICSSRPLKERFGPRPGHPWQTAEVRNDAREGLNNNGFIDMS
jgi:hypothetical protein